jgi:L-fuculose-phosphate aldolase
MQYEEAKMQREVNEIIETGKLMYQKGYNVSIDGNISIRLSDKELLITASGSRLGFLTEDDIVITDYEGNLLKGNKKATSERVLHTQIYKERTDINAVIHAHAPHSIALSMLDIDIENNMYATVAPIPITKFAMPSSEESYLNMKPFIQNYNWGILQRHGVVTYEKDLLGAFLRLEGMEHLAKILIYAFSVKKIEPLSTADKNKLLKSWGLLKEENAL